MTGPRIVIVEHDPETRNALIRYFSARGWQTVGAGSTAEGLMRLDPPPACVLLDLMEPARGGELLLWKIRSEKLSIRVVVTAAKCDDVRARAVLSLEPDVFLEKPVDAETLYRACEGGPGSFGARATDTGICGRNVPDDGSA